LRPTLVVLLTLVACAALFVQANQQPQHKAFALLESPPVSQDAARYLLEEQDTIRVGLLNAYLAPFRYISAVGEVVHVREIYSSVFNMSDRSAADVQGLYEALARPLLYHPVHPIDRAANRDNVALRQEPQEAAALYQRFFDSTIVEGEREAIVHAVRSTWSLDQAESAWQAVDDREIYLVKQEVTVQEHGDWAQVELFETYQNQTSEPQEVIYYFNLPESAVLTGVWLGNSPDRQLRFAYQVAPRGAAQAVYRNETRIVRDPALLEQIGPRQYRLRVYPVPAMRLTWDADRARSTVVEGDPLYMWMTFQVMAKEKAWPLPGLAFLRNVYWDRDTVRLLNGELMRVDGESWLPDEVPAEGPVLPRTHRVDLPGGESVVAIPAAQLDLPTIPPGLRAAVVLDRSRSMADHAGEITTALSNLQGALGPQALIDVFLTSSPYRGEAPLAVPLADLDPGELLYFGGQNAAELLAQFQDLREEIAYDAVLVFTDGSGYELGDSEVDFPRPDAPVWMVHMGGDLPLGYDDVTLEAIQASGGGVVGELEAALARLAVALSAGIGSNDAGASRRDVLDGYLWAVLPTGEAQTFVGEVETEAAFKPFAARRLILADTARRRAELDQPGALDQLHALAVENSVVTPYSSMIVLVTPDQQRILDHLAQGEDRFQREFEELGDTTPATPTPLTGVPEPHEWLLIGLAIAMLIWYASRERWAWARR
jgi:putative PEP-CTERM system integral membrane protein